MSKEYEVGYGKPPKSSQFKKGASGNPGGRPKGVKNFSTYLMDELAEKVRVTEGGKQIVINKEEATFKSLIAAALNGNVRATIEVIKLIRAAEEMNAAAAKLNGSCTECQCVSKDQFTEVDLDKVLEGLGVQQ